VDANRCATCGSENVAGSAFCGNCGGPISTVPGPQAPVIEPAPVPVASSRLPAQAEPGARSERSKLFKAFAAALVLLGGLFTYALAWVIAMALVVLAILLVYRFVL
jgi:hypothetical protein